MSSQLILTLQPSLIAVEFSHSFLQETVRLFQLPLGLAAASKFGLRELHLPGQLVLLIGQCSQLEVLGGDVPFRLLQGDFDSLVLAFD